MVQKDKESIEAGKLLAHPPPGEEVVISGTSGCFPDSDTVTEFADKLFNKVDLISGDGRRWTLDHPEIPRRTGKLKDISRFDAGYFGIHYKQAHAMDPMCRIVLEKAAEAVFDAGYNPQSLFGAKIGVFVGACFSETEKTWFYEKLQVNGFGVTGCARAMLANRISYWLGVKGPSYTIDTACSSSLYALEHGYKAIREGLCDAAIVAGSNLCLHPFVSLQFSRLGVLSKDGRCKCFDESADGYCRSEGISAMFLQKSKDARRVYATVVHAKTNCDGYKEEGITFPSGFLQQSLLEEFYEECQIDPSKLAWVEAHGTGTKVGDPEEVKAIENIFCANRKGPLKMGSLKSNVGHSEPTSGLLSVTKVIIAMESGFIPPNINYKNPRKDIESLQKGKIQVITEKTPWDGGLVGVNSFGFGGANCHVLLKWNEKNKVNGGLPKDDLPRLVCISGRTQEAVDYVLSNLEKNKIDSELVKLYHTIYKDEVPGHLFRGYTILSKTGKLGRGIKQCGTIRPPIWCFFSGLGVEWKNGLGNLVKIPIFTQAFSECTSVLKSQNFDLLEFLHGKSNEKSVAFKSIFTNCIMQLLFANVLKNLGYETDKIMGTSFGEIVCAYVDGSLKFDQAVLTAFFISKAVSVLESQKGSTVMIDLPINKLKPLLSSDISIVYQSDNSCIISGSDSSIKSVMDKAKGIGSNKSKILLNIPLHNNQVSTIKSSLMQQLQKVITGNRVSSPKWLSTSVKDKKNAYNFNVTPEYFYNILINPINLDEWYNNIERNSSLFEISPGHSFESFVTRKVKRNTVSFVQLLPETMNDGMTSFLTSLGELNNCGANLDLALLYPTVEFPVSRSTPMISPLIKWDHKDEWFVCSYKTQDKITTGERFISVTLKDEEQEFISGHVIDGRNLFPATGYLFLVWETIALMNAKMSGELSVVFENVRFNRATNMPKDGGTVDFIVTIQKSSGFFEVMESGAAIVTGKVFVPEDVSREMSGLSIDANMSPDDEQFVVKPKDIYKELRIRGYNYKGLFRSITCSTLNGDKGFIQWKNNWVAFMDNMLQVQILNSDSRALFVPTGLSRVVIDVNKHNEIVKSLTEENCAIPVVNHKYVKLIKSGGIEIRGLNASAITKKKPLGEPVLENYHFLPYHLSNGGLDTDAIIRMFVHLALENNPTTTVKVFEIGELGTNYDNHLSSSIIKALADLPLIQPDIIVFNAPADKFEEIPEINVEDKKMPMDQSALMVIGCDLLDPANGQVLQNCIGSTKETGFIISRDKVYREVTSNGIVKCSSVAFGDTYFTLLKKVKPGVKKMTAISVSNDSLTWIKKLQELMKSDEYKRVIIYSQNQPLSGVLGLVNCIIKEGYAEKARCYFLLDSSCPSFSLDNPFYMKQIEKDLAINIYKDGNWGSYRHLALKTDVSLSSPHAYVSFLTRGDLSSLTWTEGHLSQSIINGGTPDFIHVYYSALNFRDVMTSTGKLAPEVVEKNRIFQDCVQGLEFSGRDSKGRRIMGIVGQKGIGTIVDATDALYWEIPADWSMEEAATVPCVYGTIVYAFYLIGKHPKKGDTILIHAGTGGIGQACIHYALFYGCKVFTTVGTPEKREFIKKTYPQLTDNQIGNSRDTSFEQLVMRETNGRGVDFVVNSLAEEKLLASVRCLAKGGRFLELGKFDMANDNPLGVEFLKREASFHGIMLNICADMGGGWKGVIQNLVSDALKCGSIRPFTRTVFDKTEVETAIRHMAAGKHIGKVLIKIREEEHHNIYQPELVYMDAKPRFYCKSEKSYVILGGLGGFGLELSDWLVLRNAKKIILSSRSGVREGYQLMRIKIWESYGVKVKVCTDDVTTEKGVISLLKKANEVGPVGGIFNLAVVLKDALLENQSEEDFKTSFGPKAVATQYLDIHSRTMCPELEHFVVFSSVSCGRGNAGQTNYGMSNSIMERICELRVKDGYPGLAIQWGAVGDVGLVANMQEENSEVVIGGTLPQKIDSCLSVMDMFLNDKHPVVASMVVAEKKAGSGGAGNMVDTVLNIIGLRDLKSVSLHSTLAELGMDSMMAVEIKQTLEREYEVFLTPQDIRGMTLAKLQDIASSKSQPSDQQENDDKNASEPALGGLQLIMRTIGDEESATPPIVKLDSNFKGSSDYNSRVFLLPGLEGFSTIYKTLCSLMDFETICVQFDYLATYSTIQEIAKCTYERMKSYINKKFVVRIVGYSYGGVVTLELCKMLEGLGYKTKICIIDGSPDLFKPLILNNLDNSSDELFQIGVLLGFTDFLLPQEKSKIAKQLLEMKDWESRVQVIIKATENLKFSREYKEAFITCIYKRLCAILKYDGVPKKSLNSTITLIRPGTNMLLEFEEDYGLSKYSTSDAEVYVVDGNHLTVMDNAQTAKIISSAFNRKN